jgi:hypothetical protein
MNGYQFLYWHICYNFNIIVGRLSQLSERRGSVQHNAVFLKLQHRNRISVKCWERE